MALFPMAQPVEVNRQSIEEARKKRTGPSLFPLKDRIEQIDFSGSPSADSVPENMGITPMPSRRPSYGINPPSAMGESFIPKGITPYSPSSLDRDIQGQPEQAESKPSLFGKIFGKKDSGSKKVDEYGLEVPETSKPGLFQKILGIGLPTLIGLAGGGGFGGLAGAATGYFGQKAGQRVSEQEALDAYNQQRLAIEKARQPSAGQKDFEYFSGLSPEQQDAYLRMKSAGSMNPLALARFDYQRSEDEEKKKIRQEENLDKYVERLQGKLGNSQDVINSLDEVNQLIGFDPEDYDFKSQTVGGKKVNLPGASIPGLGRINFYSSEARNLADAMQKLFNVQIKDRSGAAVTSNELDRLRKEWSQGKYNTEQEMINAMARYKRGIRDAMSNIEAGYSPDVVKEYIERGGVTSKRLSKSGNKQTSSTKPSGAVGIAPGSDGKRYYHDAQGNILGEAS